MQARELSQLIESHSAPLVIDVRSEDEFRQGHIPGAINALLSEILLNRAKLPKEKTRELVITCERGGRAKVAKMVLGLYGYRNVALLDGHMQDWRKAGLALEA